MELNELVRLKEQIKPKIEKGDFVVVGKMLGISQENARMRFARNKEQEILAMSKLNNNISFSGLGGKLTFNTVYKLRLKSPESPLNATPGIHSVSC